MRFHDIESGDTNLHSQDQKTLLQRSSHSWLVKMLSEMSEYAMLNNLLDVCVILDLAKCDVGTAIITQEQKISEFRSMALTRMMR